MGLMIRQSLILSLVGNSTPTSSERTKHGESPALIAKKKKGGSLGGKKKKKRKNLGATGGRKELSGFRDDSRLSSRQLADGGAE